MVCSIFVQAVAAGGGAVVCVFGSQESMEFVKLIDLMENIWICMAT